MVINYNILKNYFFIQLLKIIFIFEKDDDRKANFILEMARFSSDNVIGKYSDSFMEKELVKIGDKIEFNKSIKPVTDTVLFVMTASGITGGHTRLVNNWITFDEKRKYSIVFTIQKNSVPQFLKQTVEKSGGKIYYLSGNGIKKKAENLLNLSSSFEKVILCTHMYDVIPVIAYSNKNWTTPIYFYNHAEFKFWLGVSVSDLVLELSTDDRKKSLKDRGIINSILLPIPVKNKSNCLGQNTIYNNDLLKAEYKLPMDSKIVTSMAEDYKYTVIDKYDFPRLMVKLIKKDPLIYVVVIGGNPKEKKWKELIKTGKARVLGRLNHVEVDKILSFTDVYIDSFPLPSYTCALEAIAKNVPVLSYDVKGYCLDAFKTNKYNDFDKLINKTILYLYNKQLYDFNQIEKNIELYHYKEYWLKMMEKIFSIKLNHKTRKFTSKYVNGEYEKLNYNIFSLEKKEKNYFSKDISQKNIILIKIIAKILSINLLK